MKIEPDANHEFKGTDQPVNGITLATLQKLWLVLGVTTVFFAAVAHGQTQGTDIEPKLNPVLSLTFVPGLLDSIVAMWGIWILSLLLTFNAYAMLEHAKRTGPTWRDRYPFRMWDASPAIGIGGKAQIVAYVFFSVLPLLALGHFWNVFLSEGKLCVDLSENGASRFVPVPVEAQDFFSFPPDATIFRIIGDYYRLAGEVSGDKACEDATTFFPLIEPLFMAMLTLFAVCLMFRALGVVWRGVDQKSPPDRSA